MKKEEGVKEKGVTHEWCPVKKGQEKKEQLLVPMIIFACDIFVSLQSKKQVCKEMSLQRNSPSHNALARGSKTGCTIYVSYST